MSTKVYYGEHSCEARIRKNTTGCTNKAYFQCGKHLYCGQHSRNNKSRRQLPKNPNAAAQKEWKLHEKLQLARQAAEQNKREGVRGKVIVRKMKMMKPVECVPGFRLVFPNNNKHGNRKDGVGCPELSPMRQPVVHIMPRLPNPVPNLENFHQGAKVFSNEIDPDTGELLDSYWTEREKMYRDSVPHRHKQKREKLAAEQKNVNIPLYSIYTDREGNLRKFSYLESRYFYCKLYERSAKHTPAFRSLQELLQQGWNLQIVGYDGYEVTHDVLTHYKDTSRPFGHELVLYCLLTLAHEDQYPWNLMYKSNEARYKGFGIA